MRFSTCILPLMVSFVLVSCITYMDDMDINDATPVIRTDFSDEATWKRIKRDVTAKNIMGFSANVRFIDEKGYINLTGQELLQSVPGLTEYGCVFVADDTAMSDMEHHLLVLDPFNPKGRTFRVIPSLAWAVENNLSLSNMDYSEFVDAADPDGILRGLK